MLNRMCAGNADRNDRSVGVSAPELLDFGAHPSRLLQRAAIGDDNQGAGAEKGLEQGTVKLLAGRGFVLAEENGEVAVAQAARQIRGVTVGAARRRAEGERDKHVVAEDARRVVALWRAGLARLCRCSRRGCSHFHLVLARQTVVSSSWLS